MRHITQDPNVPRNNLKKVAIFLLISGIIILCYTLYWFYFISINDLVISLVFGFLWLVPSMITNALMPLVANIKGIPRYPIDGGRMHKDGQRILGDGKSWNGLIGGTIVGFILSWLLLRWYFPIMYNMLHVNFADGETIMVWLDLENRAFVFVDLWDHQLSFWLATFFMCLGAPVGDAVKSYYKRRKGVDRGDVFLFWDQNDFILASIIMTYPFFPIHVWGLLLIYYVPVIMFTPFLTVLANICAYYIGKKKVPY